MPDVSVFKANGLVILERNYLDVYWYEKWNGKEIGDYRNGQRFTPDELMMEEGKTTAPPLLTEVDLITLMERHGIGTDATHAEHIEKIKERQYVVVTPERRFIPTPIGYGLIDGYRSIKDEMTRPDLRAGLERDLQAICDGQKEAITVLDEQIMLYKGIYCRVFDNRVLLENHMKAKLDDPPHRGHTGATGSDGENNHDSDGSEDGGDQRRRQRRRRQKRKP